MNIKLLSAVLAVSFVAATGAVLADTQDKPAGMATSMTTVTATV